MDPQNETLTRSVFRLVAVQHAYERGHDHLLGVQSKIVASLLGCH